MSEQASAVKRLQQACADAFAEVTASLQVGMSEAEIANALRSHLAARGITEHWYDVPFIVLIGPERFRIGTTTTDYAVKAPSAKSRLHEGQVVYADFSPIDSATGFWGDWSSNCVFQPGNDESLKQLEFLKSMQELYLKGIGPITAKSTGADVAQYFSDEYARRHVTLADVHNNVGHSMHSGPKLEAQRIWLDFDNHKPLGAGIFTVEPGGISNDGRFIVRYEECIDIPHSGQAQIVGGFHSVPLAVYR